MMRMPSFCAGALGIETGPSPRTVVAHYQLQPVIRTLDQ